MMRSMNPLAGRAYIAPEGIDEPIVYSGYIETSDGTPEFSPRFVTLSEAVKWARARTDFVIARDVATDYFWYGNGPAPSDITTPPEDK